MAEEKYAIQILAPAQAELEDIVSLYASLSGASSAKKIADRIFDVLEQLSRFPLSGPSMRDAQLRSLGYRFIGVEKYIVIYRLIEDTVIIYHIFDGRSDYPTLFRSEFFK